MSTEIETLRATITAQAEELRQLDQALLALVHQAEAPVPAPGKPILVQIGDLIRKAGSLFANQQERQARLDALETYATINREFGERRRLALQARVLAEKARSLTSRAGQLSDQYKLEPSALQHLAQRLIEQGVARETLDDIRHAAAIQYSYEEAKRDVENLLGVGEPVGAATED